MYFVCSYSKKIYNNVKKPITFSDIGKPLEVRYNWEGVKKDIDVDESQKTLWRYKSVLPKWGLYATLLGGASQILAAVFTLVDRNDLHDLADTAFPLIIVFWIALRNAMVSAEPNA